MYVFVFEKYFRAILWDKKMVLWASGYPHGKQMNTET